MIKIKKARHKISYHIRKLIRGYSNLFEHNRFARFIDKNTLEVQIAETTSPIMRNFSGAAKSLFENKRTNLGLAIAKLNHITIKPNELFSFWHLVGAPIRSRGYVNGLAITQGIVSESIGGGLCQLANAMHWLGLHSDLEVTERHRHSLDIFPDDSRTIPFGTGATVLYNYKDLRFYNPTAKTYQFIFQLNQDSLNVKLYTNRSPEFTYSVFEKEACFENRDGVFFRSNVIARKKISAQTGESSIQELFKNSCQCLYTPKDIL